MDEKLYDVKQVSDWLKEDVDGQPRIMKYIVKDDISKATDMKLDTDRLKQENVYLKQEIESLRGQLDLARSEITYLTNNYEKTQ